MTDLNCLEVPPLKYVDNIPVFSELDEYVRNYQQISEDHLADQKPGESNPWINETLWSDMEEGTLDLLLKYFDRIQEKVGDDARTKILDVGVGTGRLLSKFQLQRKVIGELWGIDISIPYLRLAGQQGINVLASKIEDIPFARDYFDIVVSTDVLEHVVDLNLGIGKMLSVLRPGGFLIIRVPNKEDLSRYLRPDYPYYFAHLRAFDRASLELLLTRVFGCAFLESKSGPSIPDYSLLKYQTPIRGHDRLLRLFLKSVMAVSRYRYQQLLRYLYHPIEINVVVQKPLRST